MEKIVITGGLGNIGSVLAHKLVENGNTLEVTSTALSRMNPLKTIERGYAYLENEKGKQVTSIEMLDVGEPLVANLKDGKLHTKIEKKEKRKVSKE